MISNQNDFSYFDLRVAPITLPNFDSAGLLVQEKKCKTDFHDGCHGGYLGTPVRKS